MLHICVYCSIIHNNQDLKSAEMPITELKKSVAYKLNMYAESWDWWDLMMSSDTVWDSFHSQDFCMS
jgi:hypothetical protein